MHPPSSQVCKGCGGHSPASEAAPNLDAHGVETSHAGTFCTEFSLGKGGGVRGLPWGALFLPCSTITTGDPWALWLHSGSPGHMVGAAAPGWHVSTWSEAQPQQLHMMTASWCRAEQGWRLAAIWPLGGTCGYTGVLCRDLGAQGWAGQCQSPGSSCLACLRPEAAGEGPGPHVPPLLCRRLPGTAVSFHQPPLHPLGLHSTAIHNVSKSKEAEESLNSPIWLPRNSSPTKYLEEGKGLEVAWATPGLPAGLSPHL